MTKRKDLYKLIPELTVKHEIRVRFNECDPLGIVWHGNYIKYFEDGREAFGRKHGISYLDVMHSGFSTPIVTSNCKHQLSLKYGDVATVKTEYFDSPAAKIVLRFTIYDTKGNVCCTGETVQVFLDLEGNLQLSIPPFYHEWKQKNGLL
ncbi:acyl-CoA thioesterase [Flavobacterium silvaticum]|uniref:Acyl-CoA thioesterase n=1 Tax=Flavobacterium silvaticum TaxID=1852020 RepID=A0A972FU86_9FLAO|nr:acyl-CoA thioesterase [Flavobacterium silvaticum]NMH27695.1 acyl-CoA thioesterase [Flavobacterium silvaticum]